MSFEDDMIEDGFYDEQDYFEYVCDKAMQDAESRMIEERQSEEERLWDNMLEECHDISTGDLHNFKFAKEYIQKGDEYFEDGKPLLAEECYKKAVEIDENNAETYYKLGKVNHFSNCYCFEPYSKYDEAIKNYKKAIELKKDFCDAYANLASCYHSLHYNDEAISYWKKSIELNHPNSKNLSFFMAEAYTELKQYDKVIECCLEMNPRTLIILGDAYKELKNYDKAISLYEEIKKNNLTEAYYGLGDVYYRLKKYSQAIDYYHKTIKHSSHFGQKAYYGLGLIHYELKDYDQAINYFNLYLKGYNYTLDEANTYVALGKIYLELKKADRAKSCFMQSANLWYKKAEEFKFKNPSYAVVFYTKIIELIPDYIGAYYSLVLCYQKMKNYDKAIICFQKLIELNPKSDFENFFYNKNMGDCYIELKQYENAISCYKQTIADNKSSVDIFYAIGNAYSKLKEYEEAVSYFHKIIAIYNNPKVFINNPVNIELQCNTYLKMGNCYVELKQYNIAIYYYEENIKLNPKSHTAYNNMGYIYNKLYQYNKAINFCQKAIELKPQYDNAYYEMGNAYLHLGNDKKAIECYQSAARLNQTDAQKWLRDNQYVW